jgi:hypothetical protein
VGALRLVGRRCGCGPSACEPVSANAFCRGVGRIAFAAPEQVTSPERDRPRRCSDLPVRRKPGEPQPSIAATNKSLARSNKPHTGPKATNKRPVARRNSSGTAKLARPVAGTTLPVVTALWRREVEMSSVMKRCTQCHGPLGLGVRFRNVWNGRWWVHLLYCSTYCEALHELERRNAHAKRGRHIAPHNSPQK